MKLYLSKNGTSAHLCTYLTACEKKNGVGFTLSMILTAWVHSFRSI